MTRLLRPETAFFLLVFVAALLGFRERGFYDPGALWHVQVGDLILAHGFPHTDPFTYTHAGEHWIPQQWAAEVLMAVAHRVGGFDTMLLAFSAGLAAVTTAIFARCLSAGMGPLLAGLVVGGSLCVGAFHYFVRPHMFTLALMAWTMMCVIDFDRGRCTVWRLAGLVPLYVLWTNLHGGVLGGVLTLGLATAWWVLNPFSGSTNGRSSGATAGRTAKRLIPVVVVAACALTPLVNPFGFDMLRTWGKIVGSKVLPEYITEHMPLDPTHPLGLVVIAYAAFYLFLLAGVRPRDWRATWLLPLVWLVLSFKGIRQAPLFAVTAAVAIADVWPHTRWHVWLKAHGDGTLARNPDPTPRGWLWAVVPAFAVAACLALQAANVRVPVVGRGWAKLDPAFIPVKLTPGLQAYAATVPPGTRIFNDANLGGYLIYHTPSLRIFMDDRCELFGDAWIKTYADALDLPPADLGPVFERWADGCDRAVIVTAPAGEEKPSLERYLLAATGRWREIDRCPRAVVFERIR